MKRPLFDQQASEAITDAFMWLERRAKEKLEPVTVYRVFRPGMLFTERECADLRQMAKQSGWAERGGEVIRKADLSKPVQYGYGEIVGRTHWVGQPEWARGYGYSVDEIKAIVEKAIAGEKLGTKQTLLMQSMLDALAEISAKPCPF